MFCTAWSIGPKSPGKDVEAVVVVVPIVVVAAPVRRSYVANVAEYVPHVAVLVQDRFDSAYAAPLLDTVPPLHAPLAGCAPQSSPIPHGR